MCAACRRPAKKTMWQQFQPALSEPAEWLGDLHPLVEQLGSTHGLVSLGEVSELLQISPVHDSGSLRHFLRDYHREILLQLEWPAIRRAFDHACRHELRELVDFDRQYGDVAVLKPFAEASRRVGQCELQKLRPLRDERLVRRYLEAVGRSEAETGRAAPLAADSSALRCRLSAARSMRGAAR